MLTQRKRARGLSLILTVIHAKMKNWSFFKFSILLLEFYKMAVERTLSIVKPDAVAKNVIGKIYSRFEEAGLKIVAARMLQLSVPTLKAFTLFIKIVLSLRIWSSS